MADVATALTNSLDRTGKGGLLAPLLFTDGTLGLPSISFTAEPTSGFYRAATNDIRLSIGGVARFQQTAAATTLNQQLIAPTVTVSGTVTANTSVVTPLATITEANITTLNATTVAVPNATVTGTLTVGDIQGTTATIGTVDATTYLINGFNYTSVILTAVEDAETAETNAAASAAAASTSASNASTSETNAAASESAASASAAAAGVSETNAAASETAADASAVAAAASAASIVGDAAAAAASAAAALVSEGNAATSETNAAASALAASNSEASVAADAAAAATSAGNAATSEANAAASEAAAAASFDSFDDRYLGAKSVPPTLDNDGNPLIVGALYFDSVQELMKVWSGTAWLDAFASITGESLDQVTTTGNTTANAITVGGLVSTGNVGIGTASPGTKLEVAGDVNNSALPIGSPSSSNSQLNLINGNLSALEVGPELLFSSGPYTLSGIRGVYSDFNGAGDLGGALTFGTQLNLAGGIVERMRIDAAGNVGIGTADLTVNAAASSLVIGTTDNNYGLTIMSGPTAASSIHFGDTFETGAGSYQGVINYQHTSDSMVFFTTATERMRIDSSGKLLVGTTTPFGGEVAGFVGNLGVGLAIGCNAGTNRFNLAFYNGATLVGSVVTNTTTTSFNTSSDIRLKENIQDAASVTPIDSLKVRQFDWKADGSHQDYGFIAQELNEFFPDAVSQGETWSVDNSKLVPMMVKELQQLRARVATLEAQ
jgi:hypothetical protein